MKIKEVVVVSACRTAIGKFMGGLANVSARELAITVGKEAIARADILPDIVDEIVMGQLYTGMQGSLPARQVSMRIGLPHRSSAVSVNQNCASGMRALEIACNNIMLGKTEIGLVIGVESMTNTPYLLPKGRMGYRIIVMSKEKAKELGKTPLCKMISIVCEGVDPQIMGIGPAVAIPKALKVAGMEFADVDYWEINEAFAAQWLGVGRKLKQDFSIELDMEKVNHNGSGIALGHPVGSSGLRIVVSMYYEMARLGLTIGGASLCVGGGPAMASLWTREVE